VSGDGARPPGPGSIRPFEVPAVERSELANGLTVYAVRQGGVPIATVDVVVDAGSIRERATGAGVAHLTMNALEAGGAGRTGAELAWAFERQGVELGIATGWDDTHLVATAAVQHLDATVALLRDVVCEPAFDGSEVERFREEQLAEMLQRRQEPRALANDISARLLYGADVAYGRHPVGRREPLAALGREDTAAHHERWFTARHAALVFAGDIDPARVTRLAESHFGGWPGRGARADLEWPAGTPAAPGIHIVDRPGSVQSEIRVGHIGVDRLHPDYFALRVMNTLFGGAFTSRLNLNLREKHGFTYGVRSGFAFRRTPGPFMIQTAVATAVTVRAIEEILAETAKLRADGANEEEVRNARDYLAGVMPLELQTSRQMAARMTELFTYCLPADHFAGYRDGLAAVAAEDVLRVARQQIVPERFVIAVVGDAASIRGPLEAVGAGPVTVLESGA
jgi:zinc protease